MIYVCALRCIGKENKEKQYHKSELGIERERERGRERKEGGK